MRIMFLVSFFLLLTGGLSCAGNRDESLTKWLSGKMIKSDKPDPYDEKNYFKLYDNGVCIDKNGTEVKWEIKKGEFILHTTLDITGRLEKINDTLAVFDGPFQIDTFKVSPIK